MSEGFGYPYDKPSAAFAPSTLGADSSFIISANQHGNGKNSKKWLGIVLVLFLLLSFVVTIIIMQRRQSLADIRNYAQNDEEQSRPQQGFGGLVTEPAQVAQNLPPPCLPEDTSTRCQTTRTTITAIRVTPTATPTATSPLAFLQIFTPFFPTNSPTPTPIPTPIQTGPTATPTPTMIITTTATTTTQPTAMVTQQTLEGATATPTSIPVLSCQRVELFIGTENVTTDVSRIQYGETVRFVGYVSDVGRAVQSITFKLMINDAVIEEKQAPAALSGNAWVAQYEHTFSVYGKHRVHVSAITPK